MTDEEYQAEYKKAADELEAAAQATTARNEKGQFAKVATPEPTPAPTPEPTPAPSPEPEPEKTEPAKAADKPVDELAELRARVEKAEKMAKDNQAAFTRAAQEAAQLKREREQRERDANKPAILDANPGLEDAIRHVATAPVEQQPDPRAEFVAIVEKAHPGIFTKELEPELEKALTERLSALSEQDRQDPLVFIREITAEKLAHGERQLGKRFAAETAKLQQKSAMAVPGAGAGSGAKAPVDASLAEVDRIRNMSDAEFQKEVRRVKGY